MADADPRRFLRQQLRLHRLEHNLSWVELSDAIGDLTGTHPSPPTLIRFMQNAHKTRETIVYAIQRYLAAQPEVR